jgi:hypothetical protein
MEVDLLRHTVNVNIQYVMRVLKQRRMQYILYWINFL